MKFYFYILFILLPILIIEFSCSRVDQNDPRFHEYLESKERQNNSDRLIRKAGKVYPKKEIINNKDDQRTYKNNEDIRFDKENINEENDDYDENNNFNDEQYNLDDEFLNPKKNVIFERNAEEEIENEPAINNAEQIRNKRTKAKNSKQNKINNNQKLDFNEYNKRKDRSLLEIEKIKNSQRSIIVDSTKKEIKNILNKKRRLKKKLGFD